MVGISRVLPGDTRDLFRSTFFCCVLASTDNCACFCFAGCLHVDGIIVYAFNLFVGGIIAEF